MLYTLMICNFVILCGYVSGRRMLDKEPTEPPLPDLLELPPRFRLTDFPRIPESDWGDTHHIDYLKKYGYYKEPSNLNVDSVIFSHLKNVSIATALRAFQRMYGLNETGTPTKETTDLMRMPRCGFPDVEHPSHVDHIRKKRYNVRSRAWSKKGNVISYRLNNFNNDGLSHSWQLWAVRTAYNKWKDACRLDFWRYADNLPVDMELWHGTRKHLNCPFSFDGPGGVLAHAFNPGDGKISVYL